MAIDAAPLEIVYCAIQFMTVIITLLRLAFRVKIQRFWWEDMWAAIAMVGMIVFSIVYSIHCYTNNIGVTHISSLIASYTFTCSVWSVRMSLLYSVIRVVFPSTVLRAAMHVTGALFVVVWALLVSLKTWVWYVKNQISNHVHPWSPMELVEILEATADFTGDATLIIFSLRLLWGVKLPRRQRRMILATFLSSAIITMVSLPRAIANVVGDRVLASILVDLELIFSSIVCNLLVVVTYIYRVYVGTSESELSSSDDDFTTPLPSGPRSLTTVNLNTLDLTTVGATSRFRSSFFPSQIRSVAS